MFASSFSFWFRGVDGREDHGYVVRFERLAALVSIESVQRKKEKERKRVSKRSSASYETRSSHEELTVSHRVREELLDRVARS